MSESHTLHDEPKLDDQDVGRILAIGIAVGIPFTYGLSFLLALWGAPTVGDAATLALLPGFFIGPFLGGLIGFTITFIRREAAGTLAIDDTSVAIEETAEQPA
ncbi:MAG: hypothetical protein JJLCMIEE_00541 [Acidimicrobiales bacterium]|nr:MAG: hypothetical protein EDR02_04290 [Actinomycetota bacterium]MBV6507493.1 hypothetical protein [Acidimicrobiales bacterium]RIK07870.1 MAG: hypothetical protein DCC48_02655 [Acidobacteriota bacterium]